MNVPINDIRLHGNVRSKIDKKEDSFKELVKEMIEYDYNRINW